MISFGRGARWLALGLTMAALAFGCSPSEQTQPCAGPACGASDASTDRFAWPAAINGVAQKGPFVRGTVVTVHELTNALVPVGRNFDVVTGDDLGGFTVPVSLGSRFAEVIAS